ncbi:ATP-binding cassette domain-containing protein [Nocardioides aequoreus]|uniref:ATP-binding cassette domain-containing protein n=1 Tax=Nocardioides aequoreus TaxID=397278 RepID=UPI0012F675E5|nr:ATP-binding cassette domain-containing protein [Nocardioides aequoreus]
MTATRPAHPATANRTPDLVVDRVRVGHAGRTLVDVGDVRLEPGRALTVVGESGSGKSLLAHALMGTSAPELEVSGRMTLGAGPAHDLADRRSRRRLWGRQLALLPQEPALALDPTMRVRHQVAEGVPGYGRRTGGRLWGRPRSRWRGSASVRPGRRTPTRCRAAWPSAWRTPRPPSAARPCSSSTSPRRASTPSRSTGSPSCCSPTWSAAGCSSPSPTTCGWRAGSAAR